MPDQADRTTLKRADSDPIVIVGATPDAPPAYVEALIAAIAVTAEVVILAPDTDGAEVAVRIDRASARATQRRGE